MRFRDLRSESLVRNNLAIQFIALNRYDEARAEWERAIEAYRAYRRGGGAPQPGRENWEE